MQQSESKPEWLPVAFKAAKLGPKLEADLCKAMWAVPPAGKRPNVREGFGRRGNKSLEAGDERRRRILSSLAQSPKTYKELVCLSEVPYASLTGYIERMIGWGYVVREKDARSKYNQWTVYITSSGREWLSRLIEKRL